MTSGEGWVPAYRRIFDPEHHLADEPACRRWAWLDLCQMARYESGVRIVNGEVIELERGQFLASLRFLADRWGWSVKRVRTFLRVISTPSVAKLGTVKETRAGTVYELLSYEDYALEGTATGTPMGTSGAQRGHKLEKVVERKEVTDLSKLWQVYLDEFGGPGRQPSLTDKRRKCLAKLFDEHLADEDDPPAAFRKMLRAVKASDHHMSERAYQMPESLFRNPERRERWYMEGINANGHRPNRSTNHRLRAPDDD